METRRKVVTVVFADVVGSTALGERVDPETLRWAMQRWFDRMRSAIERHGGTVENYIGDAVMAVFGIPVAHEDDALRAVRAATEMRAAVAALGDELRRERGLELAVRIGVNTGEVVTGAAAGGGSFTAGDAVNVAARFEQSARPGDIVLGHDTFRLVEHAVDAESLPPLALKGKSAPLDAYRLLAVAPDARERPLRPRAPMFGRQRERRRVLDAFHQAVADRSCQLFTVLGAAGVGKSRLVAEVVETIDGAATVTSGRCLPYGDGLTWWPLVEALRGSGLLASVRPHAPDAAPIVESLLEPAGAVVAPEEAFWAVRKVLEALARRQPLVLVVDDLHWAEPTFVELVEHVADRVRDAPLLLLIMARPELLDRWPGWGGGMPNSTSVLLEPLARPDAADLLAHVAGPSRLDARATERILDVAEGNPLFVEELVAVLADARGGELPATVPPTIQALLAARLDRLSDDTRAVIEAAAVEGKEFGRDRIEWLVESELRDSVGERLLGLVRTDLIRPADGRDDSFRFRHQLIRDAAYDGIPKERRAVLHERFADWLDEHRADVPAADELLGHHLESAVLLRRDLGAGDEEVAGLAARAARSLLRAGRRANAREEPAARRLLERALALAPDADRPAVLVAVAEAVLVDGELRRAAAMARDAIGSARAIGDHRSAARAQLVELWVTKGHVESDHEMASIKPTVAPLIAEFERLGDDDGLAEALRFMGYVAMDHYEEAVGYLERALVLAERAGDRAGAARAGGAMSLISVYGPLPVPAALERCRDLRRRFSDVPGATASIMGHEALLLAMHGDIDAARKLHDEADGILEDVGNASRVASRVFTRANVELLAGAPARAESVARASFEAYEAMNNRSQASTAAAFVALALVEQGRDDEALDYADLAAGAVADDYASQVTQLAVRARVLARRGDLEAAEAAARDAVALSGRSDDPWVRGEALTGLASVLEHAGQPEQAHDVLRQALAIYECKGNVVLAERVRARIGYASGHTSST